MHALRAGEMMDTAKERSGCFLADDAPKITSLSAVLGVDEETISSNFSKSMLTSWVISRWLALFQTDSTMPMLMKRQRPTTTEKTLSANRQILRPTPRKYALSIISFVKSHRPLGMFLKAMIEEDGEDFRRSVLL